MSNSNKIEIPKKYLEKILKSINRLTESCVLKLSESHVYSVASSSDDSVILYARLNFNQKIPVENERINLIDIKKFLMGLNCIENINENIEIHFNRNNLLCQSIGNQKNKTHFKYHLVDDTIIKECSIKIEKIASVKFDTEFILTEERIKQILKGMSFATDVSKVYFRQDEDAIVVDIDDKTMQNVDCVSIPIADTWEGERIETAFPMSAEIFKNLILAKGDVTVKINNDLHIAIFDLCEDDVMLKYIVSALIK